VVQELRRIPTPVLLAITPYSAPLLLLAVVLARLEITPALQAATAVLAAVEQEEIAAVLVTRHQRRHPKETMAVLAIIRCQI
jgi:hypothetical protein